MSSWNEWASVSQRSTISKASSAFITSFLLFVKYINNIITSQASSKLPSLIKPNTLRNKKNRSKIKGLMAHTFWLYYTSNIYIYTHMYIHIYLHTCTQMLPYKYNVKSYILVYVCNVVKEERLDLLHFTSTVLFNSSTCWNNGSTLLASLSAHQLDCKQEKRALAWMNVFSPH